VASIGVVGAGAAVSVASIGVVGVGAAVSIGVVGVAVCTESTCGVKVGGPVVVAVVAEAGAGGGAVMSFGSMSM